MQTPTTPPPEGLAPETGSAGDDPYASEDYQRYIAECVEHCECTDELCDSVLAGGLCEMRIREDDDEDDYSPVEPYHDEDGCPST